MNKIIKHTSNNELWNKVLCVESKWAAATTQKECDAILTSWGMIDGNDFLPTFVAQENAWGFAWCVNGEMILTVVPNDEEGAFFMKKDLKTVRAIREKKEMLRDAKESKMRKIEIRAKKEEAKKKDDPMKNMVNGFKNKISSLEVAIYNRDNIITKKDDEIVALKKRIASLALEVEQVRNENSELAIYKELVEEAA